MQQETLASFLSLLPVFVAAFGGVACGGGAMLFIFLAAARKTRHDDILIAANGSIALLLTLVGRLINFKKDHLQNSDDETAPWVALSLRQTLPEKSLFVFAGHQPDLIQLIKMLDDSLCEQEQLIDARNNLLREDKNPQAHLYLKTMERMTALTDENILFADQAIEKIRVAAQKALPKKLHGKIATVALKPDAAALMPKKP